MNHARIVTLVLFFCLNFVDVHSNYLSPSALTVFTQEVIAKKEAERRIASLLSPKYTDVFSNPAIDNLFDLQAIENKLAQLSSPATARDFVENHIKNSPGQMRVLVRNTLIFLRAGYTDTPYKFKDVQDTACQTISDYLSLLSAITEKQSHLFADLFETLIDAASEDVCNPLPRHTISIPLFEKFFMQHADLLLCYCYQEGAVNHNGYLRSCSSNPERYQGDKPGIYELLMRYKSWVKRQQSCNSPLYDSCQKMLRHLHERIALLPDTKKAILEQHKAAIPALNVRVASQKQKKVTEDLWDIQLKL